MTTLFDSDYLDELYDWQSQQGDDRATRALLLTERAHNAERSGRGGKRVASRAAYELWVQVVDAAPQLKSARLALAFYQDSDLLTPEERENLRLFKDLLS